MESITKTALAGLMAYGVHYTTVKAYDTVCIPDGIWGFLQGFVTMGSPMCQMGVNLIKETQTSYSSFLLIGVSRFLIDMIIPGAAAPTPA